MPFSQNDILSISGVIVTILSVLQTVSHQLTLRSNRKTAAKKAHRAAARKPK